MKHVTPRISLVAYDMKNWIFVSVPGELGRYVRTHHCVAHVGCPRCEVAAGEPCRSWDCRKGLGDYQATTHFDRRDAYNRLRRLERAQAQKSKP